LAGRIIAVKLPEEVYEEVKRRAERLGYALVADYVRDIILRDIGYEARRDIAEIVREEVKKALSESGGAGISIDVGEIVNKVMMRVEKKLQDLINPWTAKVDELSTRLAEIVERVEGIEQRLASIEAHQRSLVPSPRTQTITERKARRKTAIERLRDQGVVFEHEVQWLRDRDAFFERLRREGALIIEVNGERIAVDREFWQQTRSKIEKLSTANDDEIRLLLTRQQYDLFRKLKEAGYIYFDATNHTWKFIEEPTEMETEG